VTSFLTCPVWRLRSKGDCLCLCVYIATCIMHRAFYKLINHKRTLCNGRIVRHGNCFIACFVFLGVQSVHGRVSVVQEESENTISVQLPCACWKLAS
jgi:hypothetical protein